MEYTTLFKSENNTEHFNNLIVTHEDLDGLVSAKIIEFALDTNNETSYIVSHFSPKEGTTTSIIYDILFNQKITVDKIWILDRQTLTPKGYSMIKDKISELIVIDHHPTQLASEYYHELYLKNKGNVFHQIVFSYPMDEIDYVPSAALMCYYYILKHYENMEYKIFSKIGLHILAKLTSLWDTFQFKYLPDGLLKNCVLTLQAKCSYTPSPIFFEDVIKMIMNDDSIMYIDMNNRENVDELLNYFYQSYKKYLDYYNKDIRKVYSCIIDDNANNKTQLMNLPINGKTYKTLIAYYNHDIALMSSVADELLNNADSLDILVFITPLGNISVRIHKDVNGIIATDVCSLVCEKYGGHSKAAGGSMIEDVNQLFIEKFLTYLKIDNAEDYLISDKLILNTNI